MSCTLASEPWSLYITCENLEGQHHLWAEIWFSEKVDLGGSKLKCPTLFLVDHISPDFFFSPNAGGIAVDDKSF